MPLTAGQRLFIHSESGVWLWALPSPDYPADGYEVRAMERKVFSFVIVQAHMFYTKSMVNKYVETGWWLEVMEPPVEEVTQSDAYGILTFYSKLAVIPEAGTQLEFNA